MRVPRRFLQLLALVLPVARVGDEFFKLSQKTGVSVTGATAANPTADGAAPVSPETGAEADQTPGTMTANDTFVPTVEISEDLSVSFPADI